MDNCQQIVKGIVLKLSVNMQAVDSMMAGTNGDRPAHC